MRWPITLALAALSAVAVAVVAWQRPGGPPAPPPPGPKWFEDAAARAGVAFRHFDPATPQHLMPETMGSGVGWIDYDADGRPDLFCVQDGPIPPATVPDPPTHRLYRNLGGGRFEDVTDRAGLAVPGFGVGVAVGDYDNDGFDDLAVTYLNGVGLYHNEPDGAGGRRFRDVTGKAGLANPHYGTSLAWGDLDGDGFLDLYVCNYVEIDPARPVACKDPSTGIPIQCAPTAFPLAHHRLFRNNGDGTFADVSASGGVAAGPRAPGLGVVVADLDGDGRPDVYVANDLHPAYFFRNKGNFTFEEVALGRGCGLGFGGSRMAGMGVEAFDADGTGRPSLFVTNYQNEPNVLFVNRGGGRFADATYPSGLGGPSLARLGFGAVAFDADGDGNPDLAVANGHVQRRAAELHLVPYPQAAQLFLGDGTGKFRDASADAGADFEAPRVGRGLARCDFDGDGAPDLAVASVGGPLALLRNGYAGPNRWVGLDLVGDGRRSNRNAIGAVVETEAAGRKRTHFVVGGGSYLSANDRRLAVGVGTAAGLDRVTVRWPSGAVQEFRDLPAGRSWRLTEGKAGAE
jgi:hypothetical protein